MKVLIVDDERFDQALERARSTLASRTLDEFQSRLESLLDATVRRPDGGSRYQERIGVELRGQIRVVPVDRIDYIAASGAYAEVHTGDETFLINDQMQELEERLDPNRFFRIHRSTIVQLDRVESLHYKPGGDYYVELRDGHILRVSRGRYEDLQRRLGLDPS